MNNTAYWICFSNMFGISSARADQVLSKISSPKTIFEMSRAELRDTGIFTKGEIIKITSTDINSGFKVLEKMKSLCGFVLTPDMPEYPNRLKNIYAPPTVLYCLGALPNVDLNLAIAIVGARQPTDYGRVAATYITKGLAMSDVIIVSGLADGIDAIAHKTAIENGGKTIAVLGSGVDVVYPAVNKDLYESIYSGNGVVISEFLPGTMAKGTHFPIRNRIISALSAGVCIVEGAKRSGSLITASTALSQDRDVFAVPGSIFSKNSVGTNNLIKDGAKAVTHPNDILEEYAYAPIYKIDFDFSDIINKQEVIEIKNTETIVADKVKKESKKLNIDLEPNKNEIYEILLRNSKTSNELVVDTKIPINTVLSILTELEILGLIKSIGSGKFTVV